MLINLSDKYSFGFVGPLIDVGFDVGPQFGDRPNLKHLKLAQYFPYRSDGISQLDPIGHWLPKLFVLPVQQPFERRVDQPLILLEQFLFLVIYRRQIDRFRDLLEGQSQLIAFILGLVFLLVSYEARDEVVDIVEEVISSDKDKGTRRGARADA